MKERFIKSVTITWPSLLTCSLEQKRPSRRSLVEKEIGCKFTFSRRARQCIKNVLVAKTTQTLLMLRVSNFCKKESFTRLASDTVKLSYFYLRGNPWWAFLLNSLSYMPHKSSSKLKLNGGWGSKIKCWTNKYFFVMTSLYLKSRTQGIHYIWTVWCKNLPFKIFPPQNVVHTS